MLRFTANLSLLFTEVTLEQRFEAAKSAGFKAVEIQFPYELPAHTIHQALTSQQLQLALFNVDADDLLHGGEGLAAIPEKQAQFRTAVAQAADYAKILKPEAINILPGRCFESGRLSEYQQTFIDNLRYALAAFSPLGIKTVFEAINSIDMPDFIIDSSEQMLAVMTDINHPDLFMQYDIYHAVRMGENPALFIPEQAHKIGHIQFADCPNRHEPGTGTINFPALFSTIQHANYSGWIGAEYKPLHSTESSFDWLIKHTPSK